MTLIPNLPAMVTISGTDLLPINDVSEVKTKKVTVNQLTASIGAIALFGIDPQTISSSGDVITEPDAGKIKFVDLDVAANTLFTGLAATGTRKIYIISQSHDFNAAFNVDIGTVLAGDTLLNVAGQATWIWDVSPGVFKKLI